MKGLSPLPNALYLFGGRILSALFTFFATLYSAQRVGVINFGWLSFALSLVSYALILTDFGLLTFGVRELSSGRREERLPQQIITFRLFLSLIVFIILLFITQVLKKPAGVKRLIFFYSLFLFINSLSLEWFFQSKERMDYVGINRVLTSFGYLFFLLLLVREEGDYAKVPFAFHLGQALGIIFLLLAYERGGRRFFFTLNFKVFKEIFLSAFPLGIINALQIFYTYFGIILLGLIGQSEELGIYSAMHRLLFSTLIIDFVFSFLFLPLISSFVQTQPEKLPKVLEISNRFILLLTLPVILIVLIFSPSLISLFFGKAYLKGEDLLRILIFFLPLTTLSTLYAASLIAQKKERFLLRNTGLGTLLNILLSFLFYPQWRGFGIALAFVIGELVILALNLLSVRRMINFSFARAFLPIVTNQEIRFLTRREV